MHESPGQSVVFLLGVAYRKVAQLFQQQIKSYNLTPEQWVVLCRIGEEDGLIQREIGERAAKDKPTVTRILTALEEKGFIRKSEGKDDRRSFRIHITTSGKELIREIEPLERAAMSAACDGMTPEEYRLFIRLLRRLIDNSAATGCSP